MCFKKGRYKLWGFYLLSDGCRDTRLEKWEMVQLLYRLNTGWGRTEKEATCLPSTVYVCCPGATDTSVNEEGSQAEWIGWLLDSCASSLLRVPRGWRGLTVTPAGNALFCQPPSLCSGLQLHTPVPPLPRSSCCCHPSVITRNLCQPCLLTTAPPAVRCVLFLSSEPANP